MSFWIRSLLLTMYQKFISKEPNREFLFENLPENPVCGEIGVWRGQFSRMIMDLAKPSKLHLIDPWEFQPAFKGRFYSGQIARSQKDMDTIMNQVKKKFAGNGNVLFHRGYSDAVVAEFPDDYFDFLYIDGNHSYEFVKKDLELYHPKVKKGGLITGDDYAWGKEENYPIQRAVEEFVEAGMAEKIAVKNDQFVLRK